MSKAVRHRDPDALRRNLVVAGMVIVVLALLYVCAVRFLPDTWAGAARRQAGGSLTSGLGWGIFYGFIFTFFPALVIGFACYRRRWATAAQRIFVVLIGVLLSAPNLLTAGIVFGRTPQAEAAHGLLSKQAPGFAWATLIASIIAFLGALTLWVLAFVRRRADDRLRALRRAHGLPERPPRQQTLVSRLVALSGEGEPATSTRPAPPSRPAQTPSARPSSSPRSVAPQQSERDREAERNLAAERHAQKAGAYGRIAARGVHGIKKKLRDRQRDS